MVSLFFGAGVNDNARSRREVTGESLKRKQERTRGFPGGKDRDALLMQRVSGGRACFSRQIRGESSTKSVLRRDAREAASNKSTEVQKALLL